ncbi:MAG: hypothetical protein NVSMB64_12190 [Candidatus Velthaea sp.]
MTKPESLRSELVEALDRSRIEFEEAVQTGSIVLTSPAIEIKGNVPTRGRKKPRRRQRGTGSVRERFPGKWEMRYKDHDEMIAAPNKTAAHAELEKWVERIRNGGLPKKGTMTFGELVDRYLAARKGKVAPTTLAWYRRNADQHLCPILGEMALPEITTAHIEAALDGARDRSRTKRRGEHLGPASIRNLFVAMRAVLAWTVKKKLVTENVALAVELPTTACDVAERAFLGVDDVKTFLAATHGTELEAIVATAIFTGLRRSELCALQWGDLDLEDGRYTVRRAAANVDGKVIIKAPKSKTSRRSDHLSPFVVAALRRHRDEQQARYLSLGLAARLHGDARRGPSSSIAAMGARGTQTNSRNTSRGSCARRTCHGCVSTTYGTDSLRSLSRRGIRSRPSLKPSGTAGSRSPPRRTCISSTSRSARTPPHATPT